MLVDWAIYFGSVWGLAFTLNNTLFKDRVPSSFVKWSLTVVLFLSSLVALTVVKYFRYKYISQIVGFNIPTQNPFDMGGALLGAFLFFRLLGNNKLPAKKISVAALTERKQVPPSLSADSGPNFSNVLGAAAVIDAIYERIDRELRADNLDRATWARAQGDAEGNADRAKALYIKYRAQRLIAASREESDDQSTSDAISVERTKKKYNVPFLAAGVGILVCAVVAAILLGFFTDKPAATRAATGGGNVFEQIDSQTPAQDAGKTSSKSVDWSQFTPVQPSVEPDLSGQRGILAPQSSRNRQLEPWDMDWSKEAARSREEGAAKFGLTVQEYIRREARRGEICRDPAYPNLIELPDSPCSIDVMAGRRR